MANHKMRIKLKSYDATIIDEVSKRIVATAKDCKCEVSGPIPLPTDREIVTVIRSPHKHKDSREQFECRTHKRIIDVINPSKNAIDTLRKIEIPAGVDIYIKA